MPRPSHRHDLAWRRDNLCALLLLCSIAGVVLGVSLLGNRLWFTGEAPVNSSRVAAACEKINPNTASIASLRRLSLIGPAKARAIVEYRASAGGETFRFTEDLQKVKGIGPGIVQRSREYIDLPAHCD